MQTALYGKIKESRGMWLIGANTRKKKKKKKKQDKGA